MSTIQNPNRVGQNQKKVVIQKKVSKEDVLVDITEVTHEAQHWLEVYRKPLIIGAVALVALIAGWLFWKNHVAGEQKKAVTAMWRAEQMFERDSFALALNNPGGGFDGFLDIAKKYGSTPSGNLARCYSAICYYNLGKFDEAIKYMNDYTPEGSVLGATKYGVLGDAYSEKNDFANALKNYRQAANSGEVDDIKAHYLKLYGMLSEKQNDNASALSAYKEIKEKYSQTTEGRDIDKYVARAEAGKK